MKKNKTVTFQLEDPHEAELFAAAQEEHNFSGLMKRLYAKHLDDAERRKLGALGLPIRVNGSGITYKVGLAPAKDGRGDGQSVTE